MGSAFVGKGETCGELVFNTSMMGYQEIITDPSYKGQIVNMTYPLIGNYGVNEEDIESSEPQIEGFIVREYSEFPHNWRATESLKEYLGKYNVLGIENIDTRALTRHIRKAGAMKCIISTEDFNIEKLQEKARSHPDLEGRDMVQYVTCKEIYQWNKEGKFHVLALDFGIKYSILKKLVTSGCRITVVPADTPAEIIMKYNPDGVFLSNGPGDPAGAPYAVEEVKKLLGVKPILGICFGHQILGQALGLATYKLKFGHRGGNHPVKNLASKQIEISVQNHNFCLELPEAGIKRNSGDYLSDLEVTHINLNDGTLEGIKHHDLRCFSVQYHPEASPGPRDANYLFENFIELMSNN